MTKIYPDLSRPIRDAAHELWMLGYPVPTKTWHAQKVESPMIEVLNHSFVAMMPDSIPVLIDQTKPNLPWADEHFAERVSRKPLNPPPSHVRWPFAVKGNTAHKTEVFSHTYPERMWPCHAGFSKPEVQRGPNPRRGIRYEYGDLDGVITQLVTDENTRQAYLPIWFPEDTGAVDRRLPCSLGYHFVHRNGYLHCVYGIRSCDFLRHFRDDIYFAVRLTMWVLNECRARDNATSTGFDWGRVILGTLKMDITSLHAFECEREVVKGHAK